MGEESGAEVWLERVPLKYEGLSYTEIWISEAQERMVVSVPEEKWDELSALCASEGVEATVIGRFEPTGRTSPSCKVRNKRTCVDGAISPQFNGTGSSREGSWVAIPVEGPNGEQGIAFQDAQVEAAGTGDLVAKHDIVRLALADGSIHVLGDGHGRGAELCRFRLPYEYPRAN